MTALRGLAWPALTLGVGLVGGALFNALGIPLGWLLGSMILTAALCCNRSQARIPQPWRYAGQMAIGLSAGLAFTPDLIAHVLSFAPYILAAVLVSLAMGIGLSGLLVRLAGIDRTTAYFASMPGGVAEMSNLAERNGGDVASVAIAQTLRIFLAVLTVPLLARSIGHAEQVAPAAQGTPLAWFALAVLACAALLASWVLTRRRVPNAWLLGGMAIGVGTALAVGARLQVPGPILSVAQILIGASLGARLRGNILRSHRRLVGVTLGATALLLAGNFAVGWMLTALTGAGLTTTLLSTSPGGLAEMSLTAVALKADVSLVTAFHLVRTLMVALLSVPLYKAIHARAKTETP
ncbi:AbrB family transcriptional regulator [Beijerinckia sp. L45]|uniref:AbrB family transcriptional regulator n=1 Tax=Beijerinckia sp. L45 TaxID=1641855 RepID=UPI00131E5F25|nr:AbrB family transcriptional regulator [Beijerinckia sp. L45]